MKKLREMILNHGMAAFLLAAFVFAGLGMAMGQPVTVIVDGQALILDQPAMIASGGRVLVPLRGVFESLGAQVTYDSANRSINAVRGNSSVRLSIGSRQAYVNGMSSLLDTPAMVMGNRVMVPLRFVSEALGAQVQWRAYNRTINILSLTGGNYAPSFGASPRIDNVTTNAAGILMPGDTVTVYMQGQSGGIATFDISNVVTGAPMQEVSPGQYQGNYTIGSGVSVPFASVAGHLSLNGRESRLVAMKSISVGGGTTTGNLIQAISVSPRNAGIGQTVTATLQGAPGGTATMTVNGQSLLMTEGPSGTYTGTYTVPTGLQGRYVDLSANLRMPDGRVQSITNSGAIYVNGGVSGAVPLSITSPPNGTQVTPVFDISGSTEPNAVVRVRVLSTNGILGSIFGVQQEIANTQVVADSTGFFVAHVNAGNVSSGSRLAVLIQAQDSRGSLSNESRVDLIRQ